mmetsp:Transcript_7564/g.19579  ORF Transcript_7564/g.19579 Transcript_7564/m.19579 type:complete len:145 (-) Transcript_7564:412-846(-)|eukprot:CAMPEP_0113897762 /NCGR_PEP_ID=MMETSP0780_2-20120614/18917_1 /TAXON_ID=652834 /ORGANISM="Palpitomonas bilix" /LENGTH=144 /DNA_ID=CAMNT_0000889377 /DNA_START=129 /DNA_END=563 /DNA_ORIENTATION=- /assembly_acc=CAM_ASM_000599
MPPSVNITAMFYVVGTSDNPLFEADLGNAGKRRDEDASYLQFAVHASLDFIDHQSFTKNTMYLRNYDQMNESLQIAGFLTAGHTKFILVHNIRNEDAIKTFFQEVYDVYVKVLLNPFYEPNTPIKSNVFNQRVKVVGRKYLLNL